jgi:dienelactone hydrolase
VRRETLTYAADGLSMKSELFYEPAGERQPGVLVFPEAYGLSEHAIGRAKRLVSLGYVALACDLHGCARVVDGLPEVMTLVEPLYADPQRTRARALGGLHALTNRTEVDSARVAAIGFCFGGTMALELARSGADIKAVVGFHSGLSTVAKTVPGTICARILVCIGADDPLIPAEQRAEFETEMRDAHAHWQMNVYGDTVHSFTTPDAAKRNLPAAIRYNAEADRSSWASMRGLFSEAFHSA